MIVVIPCWNRPAFLAATLTCIQKAYECSRQLYLFSVDRGYDPQILDVIKTFRYSSGCLNKEVVIRDHDFVGTAVNIFAAYREALDLRRAFNEPIVLIEEDVFIAQDFFLYLYGTLGGHMDYTSAAFDAVAVSGCRNQNTPNLPILSDDPKIIRSQEPNVYRHASYQSIGTMIRPDFLEACLVHAVPDYFKDQAAYCRENLACDLPHEACSQDGLIHRMLLRTGNQTIYPMVPRAFHAGFYGYNRRRGQHLPGTRWQDDAERLLEMSGDQMNALADPRFRDIAPVPLIKTHTGKETQLKLI